MEMMDLRGKSVDELERLKFEMSCRDNMNAVSRIAEFEKYFDKMVTVVKGRKVPRGTTGRVVWMGSRTYSPYGDPWGIYTRVRIGIKDSHGVVHWTALDNVELVS